MSQWSTWNLSKSHGSIEKSITVILCEHTSCKLPMFPQINHLRNLGQIVPFRKQLWQNDQISLVEGKSNAKLCITAGLSCLHSPHWDTLHTRNNNCGFYHHNKAPRHCFDRAMSSEDQFLVTENQNNHCCVIDVFTGFKGGFAEHSWNLYTTKESGTWDMSRERKVAIGEWFNWTK